MGFNKQLNSSKVSSNIICLSLKSTTIMKESGSIHLDLVLIIFVFPHIEKEENMVTHDDESKQFSSGMTSLTS